MVNHYLRSDEFPNTCVKIENTNSFYSLLVWEFFLKKILYYHEKHYIIMIVDLQISIFN